MPTPFLGRQLSCRVKDGDEIYVSELVYLVGEADAEVQDLSGVDANLKQFTRPVKFFEVGLMPSGQDAGNPKAEHYKHFGVAMINYPYRVPADSVRVPDEWNLPLKNRTVDTDFLKGMLTVLHRGIWWMIIKVPATGSAVTIDPADSVRPSQETVAGADGGIEKFIEATDPEGIRVGKAVSNVYTEPSRDSDQWASNQVTVPTSGINIGYVLVELKQPV